MKAVFALVALAALATASPHHKRGGACPAKSSYGNSGSSGSEQPIKGDNSGESSGSEQPPSDDNSSGSSSGAVCPTDAGKSMLAGGSCDCSYEVNCDSKADVGASAKFWERTSGELIYSLSDCMAICDENALCMATIWVADTTSADYQRCWQTSGLGGIIGTGKGQISYKGACSGTCGSSYINA